MDNKEVSINGAAAHILTSLAEADLHTVIERYRDVVYRIALTHTRNIYDAQDVFQEVFVIYWRKRPLLNSEEHRKAWLILTTRNCSLRITSGSWNQKVVLLDEAQNPNPDDQEFHKLSEPSELISFSEPISFSELISFSFKTEEQNEIFRALQNLPSKYRTVLHLFYVEDMSVAQISGILQIKAGTVKVHLSRGRKMMREQLKGAYFDDE
jgi:RNA polymerase sigma-70 factor (ECF subfamily)